jgi:hypothetical protein
LVAAAEATGFGEFRADFLDGDAPEHAEASATIESRENTDERRKRVTERLPYTPFATTMHIRSAAVRAFLGQEDLFCSQTNYANELKKQPNEGKYGTFAVR